MLQKIFPIDLLFKLFLTGSVIFISANISDSKNIKTESSKEHHAASIHPSQKLSTVEKFNASIDELEFLLETKTHSHDLFNTIEARLTEIEHATQDAGIYQIINYPLIDSLKEKMKHYRLAIKKDECC